MSLLPTVKIDNLLVARPMAPEKGVGSRERKIYPSEVSCSSLSSLEPRLTLVHSIVTRTASDLRLQDDCQALMVRQRRPSHLRDEGAR